MDKQLKEFEEIWERYHGTFKEWFPTMCFPNDSEKDLISRMKECLNKNKKAVELYDLDYSVGTHY